MPHNWTPQETNRLKELWQSGLTKYAVAATLSQEFGFECTHNMVIGRVNRLKLLRKYMSQHVATHQGNQKHRAMQLTDFGAIA